MKAISENGNVSLVEDNAKINTGSVLTSTVIINKKGSENYGKQAVIENVRNNNVIVKLADNSYRSYSFDNLKSV